MFKPSVSEGISLSVFEYPQLYSRWVAYFWVKMKYLSISLLLTCQTEISAGGGGGEGGKRGRLAQSSSLNISGPQARSAKDTLVLLPLFPPPPLACTPRSHRTRGIEW